MRARLVMAKRLASQFEHVPSAKRIDSDNFPAVLARAGQKRYGCLLNFETGYTTKGPHVIVTCKSCHWHPPAGTISRTRIVVHEDGTYYFQVLLHSKETG